MYRFPLSSVGAEELPCRLPRVTTGTYPPDTPEEIQEQTFDGPCSAGERLLYNTVRLEIGRSVGTGFIVRPPKSELGRDFSTERWFLVTNRHVVADPIETPASESDTHVSKKSRSSRSRTFKAKTGCLRFQIHTSHESSCVVSSASGGASFFWLETGLDIAILNLNGIFDSISKSRDIFPTELMYSFIDYTDGKPYNVRDAPSPADGVVMVGYPEGLWDSDHNYPIVRSGTIATSPKLFYKGEQRFLIDIALYPGSSGSPIFEAKSVTSRETGNPSVQHFFLGMVNGGHADPFRTRIESIEARVKKLEEGVENLESRAGTAESNVTECQERLASLEDKDPCASAADDDDDHATYADPFKYFTTLAYVIRSDAVLLWVRNNQEEATHRARMYKDSFRITMHSSSET